jgi:hypothetical protein
VLEEIIGTQKSFERAVSHLLYNFEVLLIRRPKIPLHYVNLAVTGLFLIGDGGFEAKRKFVSKREYKA